jgi:hypothetical protein
MIKKLLISAAMFVFMMLSLSPARQGCCSHHGGVCDCACCDGTPLSAKCAPYYDCGEKKSSNPAPKKFNSKTKKVPNDTDTVETSQDKIKKQ